MYGAPRYKVIIDPKGSWGHDKYYVADKTHWKLGLDGRPTNNNLRVKDGGARVSQWYLFVDTAVQHAFELNREITNQELEGVVV